MREDGKIHFAQEHQGGQGLTCAGEDPAVWFEGHWNVQGRDFDRASSLQHTCDHLSIFLVTHVLTASCYEFSNSPWMGRADQSHDWFRNSQKDAVLIWRVDRRIFPNYEGSFYLFHKGILVHTLGSGPDFAWIQMGALHADSVRLLRQHGGELG